MSGVGLIVLMSVSMDGFAGRPDGTIDWLTPSTGRDHADQRHRLRKTEFLGPKEDRMGKLLATTQATVDGVIDPVGEWVQPDGDHGDYSFERQARSGELVLGRKTYEGWPDTRRAKPASGRTWSTRCPSTSGPTPCPEISAAARADGRS